MTGINVVWGSPTGLVDPAEADAVKLYFWWRGERRRNGLRIASQKLKPKIFSSIVVPATKDGRAQSSLKSPLKS